MGFKVVAKLPAHAHPGVVEQRYAAVQEVLRRPDAALSLVADVFDLGLGQLS